MRKYELICRKLKSIEKWKFVIELSVVELSHLFKKDVYLSQWQFMEKSPDRSEPKVF